MKSGALHDFKLSGIILAAGLSSRMGSTKQLLSYKGAPLLHHVLQAARQSSLDTIIVVLGHDARAIRENIDFTDTIVIMNELYQTGLSSSIRAGLSAVPGDHQAALFLMADQPFMTSVVINAVIQKYQTTQASIVIPAYKGKRGNPVLFDCSLFKELSAVEGDTGGRVLFSQYSDRIETIEVEDRSSLRDIDTPEDYKNLRNL